MPIPLRNRSSIYASRLYSRQYLDIRAHLVVPHPTAHPFIIHARTRDLSRGGAGLTLTRELPLRTSLEIEVVLCIRIPGTGSPLCLQAVVAHRRGFTVGLKFLEPTAKQRTLLNELCCA